MPPGTLFRYISSRTLIAIGLLLLIATSLILLIDLIENMRFAGKVEEGGFGLALSLTVMRVPALVQALIPFVFLFGAIWMFNQLNRRSEISVMRSAGLSVWRLLGPAALIAALSGLLIITVIDPVSSNFLSYAEDIKAKEEGKERSLVKVLQDGIWLRQLDGNMKLIINAQNFDSQRAALESVTVWRFGAENVFLERIDAKEAFLSGRTLELHDVRLRAITEQQERRTPIFAIPSTLSSGDLRERVASPETMSLWQLPRFILLAEAAGLPTVRYHIRFHDLCATPLKLLAMILIAAAFSLRPARMGGTLKLVIFSLGAGFALYVLSEISTAMGESGLAPVALAAWTPAVIATLVAVTALLHLEDG